MEWRHRILRMQNQSVMKPSAQETGRFLFVMLKL